MKIPSIRLKRSLNITMKEISKRISELSGLDKKALNDEYKEWIHANEGSKDHPHVLYANQINIEQL